MSRNTVPLVGITVALVAVVAVLAGGTASEALAPVLAAAVAVGLITYLQQAGRARPAPARVRVTDRRPR